MTRRHVSRIRGAIIIVLAVAGAGAALPQDTTRPPGGQTPLLESTLETLDITTGERRVVMPLEGGSSTVVARLFGGQGTSNVPSWSPDSRRVAFVSYRLIPA